MPIKLNELTLETFGLLPMPVKLAFALFLFFAIVFSGYWFDNKAQLSKLSFTRAQQKTLLQAVIVKKIDSQNLMAYRQQLKEIDEVLRRSLKNLPKRAEVPDLLEDISKKGFKNGLSFKSFKPEAEIKKGFYFELPIRIAVVGNYHQLAQFISDVAGLDRIVTLHDFTIRPVSQRDLKNEPNAEELDGELLLTITAKTYRYVDEPSDFSGEPLDAQRKG